eukprot:jgi/Bigna1/84859/estExt_fgenesh1_pg.C_10226
MEEADPMDSKGIEADHPSHSSSDEDLDCKSRYSPFTLYITSPFGFLIKSLIGAFSRHEPEIIKWSFNIEIDTIEEGEWMKVDEDNKQSEQNHKKRGTDTGSNETLELRQKRSFDSCDLNMSFDPYMWEKGESDKGSDKDKESHVSSP